MGYNDFQGYGQGNFHNTSTQDYMREMAERAKKNVNGTLNGMGSYNPFGEDYGFGGSYGQDNMYGTPQPHMQKKEPSFTDELRRDAEKEKISAQREAQREKKREARREEEKRTGNKKRFAKRLVGVAVAAALFGGISGGIFYGIAGSRMKALNEKQNELMGHSYTNIMPVSTVTPTGDGNADSQSLDVSDISEAVMPAVVAITVKSIQEVPNYFGYYEQYESEGSGSGIIIGQNDSELLIVTNNHVVEGASTVSVAFIDNEICSAKVKGTDSENDLAVIEVDLEDISESTMNNIKIAVVGNSDELKIGQQVVAIGNALGYGQSVTTGIISALNRVNSTNATPLIQVDAAINPGNSGGALLNMNGELIGINSSKYASTSVEGVGYAIPISKVQDIIDDLAQVETREQVDDSDRGYLGINCGTVTDETSETYGIPKGVLVSAVGKDSGAANAGIKKNDVITKIDNQSVKTVDELTDRVSTYAVGEKVEVTYMTLEGNDYVEKTVTVTLTEKPTEFN